MQRGRRARSLGRFAVFAQSLGSLRSNPSIPKSEKMPNFIAVLQQAIGRHLTVVLSCVLVFVLGFALVLSLSELSVAAPVSAPDATGSYHAVGNEFVAPNGNPFVPYGFVLYCLALASLNCEKPSAAEPNTDIDRIRVAASFWHANAVRIQVAPEHLFSSSASANVAYLSTLDSEVKLANQLGMVAIVTLQTEESDGPPLPTESAVKFWNVIARHFRGNSMVFFDLYNEPRLTPRLGENWMWNLWRNGGSDQVKGKQETFVGMQDLVNVIRKLGASNVIIAEGNQGDHDLSDLPQYLLTGSNIGYGMEPDLTSSDDSPTQWATNWGNLADSVPIAMEAFQDYPTAGVCNSASPTLLPELLSYLHSRHLGLIAFSLNRGNFYVGNNLQDPTTFQGTSSYTCVPKPRATSSTSARSKVSTEKKGHKKHHKSKAAPVSGSQPGSSTQKDSANAVDGDIGPGLDILTFFRANSRPASAAIASSPVPAKNGPLAWVVVLIAVLVLLVLTVSARFAIHRRRRT